MSSPPVLLVVLLSLTSLLAVFLATWALMHAHAPAARPFFFTYLCVALYAAGYAIEISRADLPGMLMAIRVEYLGLPFIPAFVFLFAWEFSHKQPARRAMTAAVMVIPLVTLLLVLTLESHSLYYIHPRVAAGGPFPVLSFERGLWYDINFAYQQILGFVAWALLVRYAVQAPHKQRRQAVTIAGSMLIPLVGGLVYILGLVPYKIDPGPLTFAASGLIAAVAFFKMGLFELVPAAREMALDAVQDGFIVFDSHNRLQDANKAALALPGAGDWKVGEALPAATPLAAPLAALFEKKAERVEFALTSPLGSVHSYTARSYPIYTRLSRLNGMVVLISDVTETAGLMQRLHHQANTDELTGLFNRRHLMLLGEQEVENSRRSQAPLGVIMLDLDHFKRINDKLGHDVGDEVLRSISRCLNKGLRSIDILGRYGGEEFVIFLPGANLAVTAHVAERLRGHVEAWATEVGDHNLHITASFGIHSAQATDRFTLDELLKAADVALYQAKSQGRNRVSGAQG